MDNETVIDRAVWQDRSGAQTGSEALVDRSDLNLAEELERVKRAFINRQFDEAWGLFSDIQEYLEGSEDILSYENRVVIADMYRSRSDFVNTEKWYKLAAELNTNDHKFWLCFASLYLDWGKNQKAFEIYKQKLDEVDDKMRFMSVYLFNRHYDHTVKRDELFDIHRQWGRLVCQKIRIPDRVFEIKSSGKIRVGYVSGDYGRHSSAFFVRSLLRCHDRRKFEVYGYGNVKSPDHVTEKLQHLFDEYRDIYSLSDDAAADLITNDRIDILVDLSGHTEGNRLTMFAQKPAPIQVSYLGYPDTTGLEVMDYRITERLCESERSSEYHSEELVFLRDGFLCYEPFDGFPEIEKLPALKNGYVTFGSFNNIRKLNPYVIGLWSRVLNAVKDSRIIIKIKGGGSEQVRASFLEIFASNGICAERVDIYPQVMDDSTHLRLYSKVDIALDSYPYHGTTTTCEAMLMGVPVVTLVGEHHMSRVGLGLLNKVGLHYFAAGTEEEFIAKAHSLSQNLESLSKIRATMRIRINNSGLCDAGSFTRKFEKTFEKMIADYKPVVRFDSGIEV